MKKWRLRVAAAAGALLLAGAVILLKWAGGADNEMPDWLASWLSTSKARPYAPGGITAAQAAGLAAMPAEPLPRDIVALDMSRNYDQGSEGLLVRELVRQAVLMRLATSSDCGLATRRSASSCRRSMRSLSARWKPSSQFGATGGLGSTLRRPGPGSTASGSISSDRLYPTELRP
jgi:hypothetical protein